MTTKNIYQRLADVMRAVSYVQKEDKKVNNQYTFVSHDAVTAKLRPALLENGIATVATVKEHKQDGNRTEVTILVRFVNVDKPEECVEVESFGYGIDPQDKGPGKAVSYAFKYALLKTFCLETGDDPEHDSIDHHPIVQQAKPKAQPKQTVNMDDATVALRECETLEALQAVFGPAYKAATAEQRITLKSIYDARKVEIESPMETA